MTCLFPTKIPLLIDAAFVQGWRMPRLISTRKPHLTRTLVSEGHSYLHFSYTLLQIPFSTLTTRCITLTPLVESGGVEAQRDIERPRTASDALRLPSRRLSAV